MIQYKSGNFIILTFLTLLLGFLSSACAQDSELKKNNEETVVLIFGGGEHHDFNRWFNIEDSTIIAETGAHVAYTEEPTEVLQALPDIDILNMNSNQEIDLPEFPDKIIEFVKDGNGLIVIHAASWHIWDWPNYFSDLIGGGTSSHGPLGEFKVYVKDSDHPLMANVPGEFIITDELYRFERVEDGANIDVLAYGVEPDTGDEYPVIWTVEPGNGRVVATTLGHNGEAHQHPAFTAFLENSIEWLSN